MTIEKYFQVTDATQALVVRPKCSGGAFAEEASRAVWPDLLDRIETTAKPVIVDMGSLSFFGSTMLDFIATINKRQHAAERKLVLADISETGREVLEISRFDQFLTLYDNVDDAIANV